MDKDFLSLNDRIKNEISLPFYGSAINVSSISEGFVITDCLKLENISDLTKILKNSIKHNKTSIVYNPNYEALQFVNLERRKDETLVVVATIDTKPFLLPVQYEFTLEDTKTIDCVFIITEYYILRRFFVNNLSENIKIASHSKSTQHIHCIGLPPLNNLLDTETINCIESSKRIILFDRTKKNIVHSLKLQNEHLINYDYLNYDNNVKNVNDILLTLQSEDITEVTLLVEGHPEIYDLMECLPKENRKFNVRPSNPLLFYAVKKIELDFMLDIFNPAFLLTSGFNIRQGITTSFLKSEIESFLTTNASILVMEMFLGDLPLILELIKNSKKPKSIFILTNMFSSEQKIFFISNNRLSEINWIEQIKGKFTSLVIIDEYRIERHSIELISYSLGNQAKI